MKNKKINGELKELMNEKGNVCVSVIIPLHSQPSDQEIDWINVDHVFEKAKTLLNSKKKPALNETLLKKLTMLRNKIRFAEGASGVGTFVSPNVARLIYFPFPIAEKVVTGRSFETRDVMYKELS